MTEASPPVSLEEARRRLKDLGYLDSGLERFVFRRAFEGRGGLFLPAILSGAFGAALACAAAVETADPAFGSAPASFAAVLLHFFAAGLLPAGLGAALIAFAADRTRRPAGAGIAAGLLVGGGVVALWIGGTLALGGALLHALAWGVAVSAAAFLAAESARAGLLARSYAHSHRLPDRRRRNAFLAVAALGMAIAASLFAARPEPLVARPPQALGRRDPVRVVAVDGLALDGPSEPAAAGLKELLDRGATGWWPASKGTPPEIWTSLSTGLPPERHGVRALERVRPVGSSLALRPPPGTGWYLRGLGRALGLVRSAPVSSADRSRLAFWEVYASAGLPSVAVGWWASGPWPGATVVTNEEVLARSSSGADVDRIALETLAGSARGAGLSTVYLPSLDILRDDAAGRAAALARVEAFLSAELSSDAVLIVISTDSHPREGGLGRMIVFERGGRGSKRMSIRSEDVAPSILARAGIPVAQDLPGRAAAALFAEGGLETATVPTYGPRVAAATSGRKVTDKEYLEKLRSLGYLN